ncbi:MAG: TAXI family TRAP transporter solute-binding subunit [Deltaproteobacteria bacterium]|jgi:TRAP transporter TAXI family solute receptor|nr:TAXI family TRAP transporter solute-binding subunit [Deltaproteobacteria bacterium]
MFRKLFVAAALAALAALALAAGPASAQDKFIKIATGNTGGVYYPVGVAMGQLFSKEIPGVISSAMSTGGSVDNIGLMKMGEAQLATMIITVAEWAHEGKEAFEGKQYDGQRIITVLWPNLNHEVVFKDIKTPDDLKGKSFVVGAARSGTEIDAHDILAGLGLYYRESYGEKVNVEPIWLNYSEASDAMKNRQVSGGNFNAYPPGSAVADLLATGDFHILSLTDEQIESIRKQNTVYQKYTIEAGTYPKQEAPVHVTGYPNLLVTTVDVDEDTVYALTKTLFENLDYLKAAHQASGQISLDIAVTDSVIPYHPGAIRYFKEKGVWKE